MQTFPRMYHSGTDSVIHLWYIQLCQSVTEVSSFSILSLHLYPCFVLFIFPDLPSSYVSTVPLLVQHVTHPRIPVSLAGTACPPYVSPRPLPVQHVPLPSYPRVTYRYSMSPFLRIPVSPAGTAATCTHTLAIHEEVAA